MVTAYHEMGHALVGHFLPDADPVHKISVVSRGQALGYTISMPIEDKFLTTRAQLEDQMAMTLGGRAAEELVFDEITTGAANDLEKVTSTAKQMTMRFGMSEKLGPRVLGHNHGAPFLGRDMHSEPDYSDDLARDHRLRDPPHHRGGAPARPGHPGRAPGGPGDALPDPPEARDDRARGVHRPAGRRVGGGGLRREGRARRRGGPQGRRAGSRAEGEAPAVPERTRGAHPRGVVRESGARLLPEEGRPAHSRPEARAGPS